MHLFGAACVPAGMGGQAGMHKCIRVAPEIFLAYFRRTAAIIDHLLQWKSPKYGTFIQ